MGNVSKLIGKAVSVTKTATVAEAIGVMERSNLTLVVVMDDSKIIGIFTLGDAALKVLRQKVNPDVTGITDYMTSPARTVSSKTKIREAIDLMTTNQIHHIPVVNAEGGLEGIISLSVLLRELLEESEISNLGLSNYIGADSMGG